MGDFATGPGANYDCGTLRARRITEIQAGLRHCFTRRNQHMLHHRVEQQQTLFVEVAARIETLDLRGHGQTDIGTGQTRQRPYARAALAHCLPGVNGAMPQRANAALAGDNDTLHCGALAAL